MLRHVLTRGRAEGADFALAAQPGEIMTPEQFVLVIGNARSGTTVVGAILDSHPEVVCANETKASHVFWRDYDRAAIIEEIEANSRWNRENGRPSSGYNYAIATPPKTGPARIVADKTWNPSLLILAGQADLIGSLRERMGCPVRMLLCVRSPFDVIATMHKRSGAPLQDRVRWFGLNCEALQIIVERDACPLQVVRHETLVADPVAESKQLFEWLDLGVGEDNLAAIDALARRKPNRARDNVEWPDEIVAQIDALCSRYPFLSGYTLGDGEPGPRQQETQNVISEQTLRRRQRWPGWWRQGGGRGGV